MTKGVVGKTLTFVLLAAGLLMAGASGCKKDNQLIEKVTFKPSDNLEVIRISLVFTAKIQSDLAGGFALKDYGYLFINPFTTAKPFELGFELNTSIVNDQDYVELTPTEVLPNGMPIGLPHPLVEVRAPNPISSKFDLYGYVDVLHFSWLGISTMFNFMDNQYFPSGLSISQVFMRDKEGRPGIVAAVFGPTIGSDGQLARNGGIALFANVRQLIADIGDSRAPRDFYPEKGMQLAGSAAPEYQRDPAKLEQLQEKLIEGFSQAH